MRRVLRGAWRKALIDVNATLVLARRRGGPAALSSVIRKWSMILPLHGRSAPVTTPCSDVPATR
jgi:hypothetical protein